MNGHTFCMFIDSNFQFNCPSYNPQRHAMSSNVLRDPKNLQPAQRRQFYDDERKRLSEMNRKKYNKK